MFADAQIGRLIASLEERGLLARTIVIVAGDHGESLGDHGERDHGIFVYESVLRVPLIVRAPGIAPARVGAVVRLTDVMPTVLGLLGLPTPAADGVSLVDLMTGRQRTLDLEAYAESMYPQRFGWSPLLALRDGRFKMIDAPRPELYDLERDPFEERNIYAERRPLADAMTRRIRALNESGPPSRAGSATSAPVPADVQSRLAALGYVGSGPIGPRPHQGRLPDPKDCIARFQPEWGPSGRTPAGAQACK
jgi:arylsulfatase A-like enzyme